MVTQAMEHPYHPVDKPSSRKPQGITLSGEKKYKSLHTVLFHLYNILKITRF